MRKVDYKCGHLNQNDIIEACQQIDPLISPNIYNEKSYLTPNLNREGLYVEELNLTNCDFFLTSEVV